MIAEEIRCEAAEALDRALTLVTDLQDRMADGAEVDETNRQKVLEARAMIWEARKRLGTVRPVGES